MKKKLSDFAIQKKLRSWLKLDVKTNPQGLTLPEFKKVCWNHLLIYHPPDLTQDEVFVGALVQLVRNKICWVQNPEDNDDNLMLPWWNLIVDYDFKFLRVIK